MSWLNWKIVFLFAGIFDESSGYSTDKPSRRCNITPNILNTRLLSSSFAISAMLVMSPDPSYGVDNYFSIREQSQDPIKVKAMKDLMALKMLQDSRLDSCVERGKDWEQCFMFGDSKVQGSRQAQPSRALKGSQQPRPPTW